MKKHKAVLVSMLGLLLAAGCSSPENRIQKSCIRGGGIGGMSIVSQQRDADTIRQSCSCFAKKLKASLSDEQMDQLAKVMDMPKDQQDQAAKSNLTEVTYGAVMGAAKSCASH